MRPYGVSKGTALSMIVDRLCDAQPPEDADECRSPKGEKHLNAIYERLQPSASSSLDDSRPSTPRVRPRPISPDLAPRDAAGAPPLPLPRSRHPTSS